MNFLCNIFSGKRRKKKIEELDEWILGVEKLNKEIDERIEKRLDPKEMIKELRAEKKQKELQTTIKYIRLFKLQLSFVSLIKKS